MPQQAIPFATMTPAALRAVHNELALERGVPLLSLKTRIPRIDLVHRVAILRATSVKPTIPPKVRKVKAPPKKKPPKAKREKPVRDVILHELAQISHYVDKKTGLQISRKRAAHLPNRAKLSVGYSYSTILARVKKINPRSRVDCGDLRWSATMVRNGIAGFKSCKLPALRVHGNEGQRR